MAVPTMINHRSTGCSLQRACMLALASDLAYNDWEDEAGQRASLRGNRTRTAL